MDCNTGQDFITQFHNLHGVSVKERTVSFFKLLRKKDLFENEEATNWALNNLQPKTYLESLFYVDTLIYFKRTLDLLEIVKQGNEIFISKILKQPWFFKDAFTDMSADELVNEFLPHTSFSIRMKILKNLSRNLSESQMDEIFDCVFKRYGLYIASNFLHVCSPTKIKEVLGANKVILYSTQVKKVLEKDLNTFKIYLDYYKIHKGYTYSNKNVINYVAVKYPELLLELKKDNKISDFTLGRRSSKKIVSLVKDDIPKDVHFYISFLNCSIVVRKSQHNFRNMYIASFPRKIDEINNAKLCNELLRHYPKNQRWRMFEQAFLHVFNKNVGDNLDKIDYQLIKLFPDIDLLHKWAEIQYNNKNDRAYLVYFKPKKAFTIIKEIINVTSTIYDRIGLLNLMIDISIRNNDFILLEEVLAYFCKRHRNENIVNRNSFLAYIDYKCKLDCFNEKHWQYINEQIKILRIKKEFNYRNHIPFTKKYLEFLFKNNKPFIEELEQFIEDSLEQNNFLLGLKNPQIEREILLQIVHTVLNEKNFKRLQDILKRSYNIYNLLSLNIIEFSLNNEDYYINLLDFPLLTNHIRSILLTRDDFSTCEIKLLNNIVHYSLTFPQHYILETNQILRVVFKIADLYVYLVLEKVAKPNRSELENEILNYYLDEFINADNQFHLIDLSKIHFWFMKYDPYVIYPYIDKIVSKSSVLHYEEHVPRNVIINLKLIRMYSHLNIDTKFIGFYKSKLNNSECSKKEKIIKYLFFLLPTEEVVTMVQEKYLPKKEKLDLQDEQMKQEYALQCNVAKSLKNVEEPGKMLPVLIKFCLGDYLQSSLRSLYSIFYRSPEKSLYLYMDILSKRAVSVRKHALFLSCELLSHDFVKNILKSTTEKNISSQKHLFSATKKYFIKNPSQDVFDVMISFIQAIDKNDTETLDGLKDVRQIPLGYQTTYIQKCWQFFESLRKKDVKVGSYLSSLLSFIIDSPSILQSLEMEFIKHIVNFYFRQNVDNNVYNLELFMCKFLRYRQPYERENFSFIFDIISSFKAENKACIIKEFFQMLYVVASEDIDSSFIKFCHDYGSHIFTPLDTFHEHVLLKVLLLKSECLEPFIESFAKSIVELFEQIIIEYGPYIYNMLKDSLNAIISDFKKPIEKYLLFYNILKVKISPINCILILDLMKTIEKNDEEVEKVYHNIMKILKNVEEPAVQIYFNSYKT